MTSINVAARSLGHHEGAMIPLKLLTAFRTGALIRLTCLPFPFIDPTLLHLLCKQPLYVDQVYIIGGDGTQKGASVIFEVLQFNMALTLISSANNATIYSKS